MTFVAVGWPMELVSVVSSRVEKTLGLIVEVVTGKPAAFVRVNISRVTCVNVFTSSVWLVGRLNGRLLIV
jgi:hypothetical protein